jgi:hypothetical protein
MIFRAEKTKNYTVMSNYHLRDNNLSLKAKGLMSLLLSLPDDWDFSINGLLSLIKESETCLRSTLDELKRFNYLIVTKYNDENGRFDYIYNLYEIPQTEPLPDTQKPDIQNLYMENGGQLNTNIINTERLNTDSKEKSRKKEKSTKITALEALEGFKEEFNLSEELTETFKDFIEMRKEIKDPITVNGLKRAINKLLTLSEDPEERIEIINQSIIAGYKGLFPLKYNNNQRQQYKPTAAPIDEGDNVIERLKKKYQAEAEEEERRRNEIN